MAIFKTNIEIIPATEEDIKHYYETAIKSINLLLEKYRIYNTEGKIEQVTIEQCKALLSCNGFFQATPLKYIFFEQKQQFVPQEILFTFRSIISGPPLNIKAGFLDVFIELLIKKGWDKPLSEYFEKQYNFPHDGVIILEELKDFSLGSGVYRATFRLRMPPRNETVTVFLKQAHDIDPYNELIYFQLEKELLPTASHAKMPCLLSAEANKETLLLSPLVPGVASDTVLSLLIQACKETKNNNDKAELKSALEILLEAFMSHAALGDLLGRNDRHLMNSLIASVVNGLPEENMLETINSPEKILAYAKKIIINKTAAISLIDIDLKWLLGENNAHWILVDIDFGLSEINLLSLLDEFNHYDAKDELAFKKRRAYVLHYFNVYCQQQEAILTKKELLLSAIKKFCPSTIVEKKLELLTQTINLHEKNQGPVIKLFKRYLLNFRTRLVYKTTLIELSSMAREPDHADLLEALMKADLLKYLPSMSATSSYESSVLLQLQCFRGVLTKEDSVLCPQYNAPTWETVAAAISITAKKFNGSLFNALNDKLQFIEKDTAALLEAISFSNVHIQSPTLKILSL